jgi:hypothetical protein
MLNGSLSQSKIGNEAEKERCICYFFMCHEPREKLPKNVLDYIRWGETECRTMIRGTRGGGKICSQALACQAREKKKDLFYGWYDLGGVEKTPIMAIRQSRYKTRFIFQKYPCRDIRCHNNVFS